MKDFDYLRLDNQLCFPLYVCAKEAVRQYRKPLGELHLTYTQFIVMMVFWEYGGMTEKELGKKVHLDSGTLAPLLKRLEKQGYINRMRPETNERKLFISLTQKGEELKEPALKIHEEVGKCINLSKEEVEMLRILLYKMHNQTESTKEFEER